MTEIQPDFAVDSLLPKKTGSLRVPPPLLVRFQGCSQLPKNSRFQVLYGQCGFSLASRCDTKRASASPFVPNCGGRREVFVRHCKVMLVGDRGCVPQPGTDDVGWELIVISIPSGDFNSVSRGLFLFQWCSMVSF
jgi:hypothetical protein